MTLTTDELMQKLENVNQGYHKFLQKYSKEDNHIYCFIEGKTDHSYYYKIQEHFNDKWHLIFVESGNKNAVLSDYNCFDWNRFPKFQVLFFIDRDLSDFLGDLKVSDCNLYVTDNYSIENDLVCVSACRRVLEEYYSVKEEELNSYIEPLFNVIDDFKSIMTPVMSWYIYWARLGDKQKFSSINLNAVISIQEGNIVVRQDIVKYVNETCWKKDYSNVNKEEIDKIIFEFESRNGKEKFIRGKFLIWILVKFLDYLSKDKRLIKNRVNLGYDNAIALIGDKVRIVESLKSFIENVTLPSILPS